MVTVFEEVINLEHAVDAPDHGGEIVQWSSHESMSSMTLVCKAWTDSASYVLFRSVSILGGQAANHFLSALSVRPERAKLVQSLVIGLRCEEEISAIDTVHDEESCCVVEAFGACSQVMQLQVIRKPARGVQARLNLLLFFES